VLESDWIGNFWQGLTENGIGLGACAETWYSRFSDRACGYQELLH